LSPVIRSAGVEQAGEVHRLMHLAFEEYRALLKQPSGAHAESVEDVRAAIGRGGAFLAILGDESIGCARYQLRPGHAYAERVAVLPVWRGKGVAAALMAAIEQAVAERGVAEIRVSVRATLPSNLRFYENLGYRALESEQYHSGHDFSITLSKRQEGAHAP
jgi:GNAT superfamily N-acetyltransferase